MIKYLTTGNFTEKKAETIKTFIEAELDRLSTKWYVQFNSINIYYSSEKHGSAAASVSAEIKKNPATGAFVGKDFDRTRLYVKLRAFHNASISECLYMIRHEFCHILQYNYMTEAERNSCREPMTDFTLCVSPYARKNQLEAWAEAFSEYENGNARYRNSTLDDTDRALVTFWEYMPF